ncbi:hypothetical protein [Thiocapsa imhoffii]|uniref:hypothetical protein n=1 Tax=Thiocapsa imhoffii TaxID=382777 RepID=UPI0019045FBB|nr:hypothetical protein [Thiocapsa imhoffii]
MDVANTTTGDPIETGVVDPSVNASGRCLELDYPFDIQEALEDQALRLGLAEGLCDLLQHVRYDADGAPGDAWIPSHVTQTLPRGDGAGHPGLPTGLVISGLLLKVCLNPLDRVMRRWCRSEHAVTRGVAASCSSPTTCVCLRTQKIMKQVWGVFLAECRHDTGVRRPAEGELILLPETTVPNSEHYLLSRLAA